MLTVCSLGSGSSGNALLVDDGTTVLLVDCGVSFAAVRAGLATFGRVVEDLAAVLLTHEHADHVRSLDRFWHNGVPVVCTGGSARAAGVPARSHEQIELQGTRELRTLCVTAIPVSHDAAEPCGFLIRSRSRSVAVVTDAGCVTNDLSVPLREANLIVIEANHDEKMLRRGPYPAPLKRRVLSDLGHLSNDACAGLLTELAAVNDRRPSVWLAHLSAVNNRPDVAISTVVQRLGRAERALHVEALPRLRASRLWRSDEAYPAHEPSGQLGLPGFA